MNKTLTFILGTFLFVQTANGDQTIKYIVKDLISYNENVRKVRIAKVENTESVKMKKLTSKKIDSDYKQWLNNIRKHYDKSFISARQDWNEGEDHVKGMIEYFNRYDFECNDPIFWSGIKENTSLGEITCSQGDYRLTLINWKDEKQGQLKKGYLLGDKAVPVSIIGVYDLDKDGNIELYAKEPWYEGDGYHYTYWEWENNKFIPFARSNDPRLLK